MTFSKNYEYEEVLPVSMDVILPPPACARGEDNRVAEASAFKPFGFCGENSPEVIFFRKKCFGSAARLQHSPGTQAGEAERRRMSYQRTGTL